jgi:DNA-binding MarR family transcriptional regulator
LFKYLKNIKIPFMEKVDPETMVTHSSSHEKGFWVAVATHNGKIVISMQSVKLKMRMSVMSKQFAVDEEFLLVIAEEKSTKGFWQLNELRNKIREKLAKQYENFEVPISQVKRSKEKLSKDGFIEASTSQARNEKGSSIKTVELTLSGLFRVLEYVFVQEALTGDSLKNVLDRVAENQKEKLLLVFEKWGYFDSLGMQEKLVERMRSYFRFFPEGYHYTPEYRLLNRLTVAGAKEVTRKDLESISLKTFYELCFPFLPRLWLFAGGRDEVVE